jgi:hypothetical protein
VQCVNPLCKAPDSIGLRCTEITARTWSLKDESGSNAAFEALLRDFEGSKTTKARLERWERCTHASEQAQESWWTSPRLALFKVMGDMCVDKVTVTILGGSYVTHFCAHLVRSERGLEFTNVQNQRVYKDMEPAGGPISMVIHERFRREIGRGCVLARKNAGDEIIELRGSLSLYMSFIDLIHRDAMRGRTTK